MGSSPDITYPSTPSYGEGMADAMKAQMEMLLGTGDFAQTYADAGFAGGRLQDVLREVEAPLRQESAQIDTDVLRQTLLGTQTKVVKDPETGKFGIPGAEVVKGEDGKAQTAGDGRYQIVQLNEGGLGLEYFGSFNQKRYIPVAPTYGLIDTETGGITKFGGDVYQNDYHRENQAQEWLDEQFTTVIKEVGTALKTAQGAIDDAGGDTDAATSALTFTNPNTGEPLKEGEVVREGDGMIDLLGDRRQAIGTIQVDKAPREYVKDIYRSIVGREPDEAGLDYWSQRTDDPSQMQGLEDALLNERAEKLKAGQDVPEYTEGSYTDLRYTQGFGDLGRQAGFDEEGNFLGLSALAEDIQRGNLSRQREADLADVERLSDRYRDVMADYKPETAAALTDAGDILKEQKNTLTGGGAITVPTGSTYGGDVTAGTMQAAQVADPLQLSANTQFGGDLATGKTATGEDTLRSALLGDARTALGQGLTEREQANIANAARARQTMMGRTFDQSGAIAEAEARVAEDNARRMQNRSFAQSVLGQEAGIQQGDITRGMAQESEQAGLQQRADLAQAQLDQQANAFDADAAMRASQVNQAQRQQANQFGVGATMDAQRLNEQLKQSGTLGYVDAATRLAALEDQQTLDPFQALLGRAGGGSLQAGQGVFGQAGYGLQSGPQYLNPEAGLGYISQMATNDANMYAANQSANASRSAGLMGGLGAIGGGIAQGIGSAGSIGAFFCWVAREVYGPTNPAWLQFREWMFTESPNWFFKLYAEYGERFANWISDKPRIKSIIRKWMDSKIGGK